jgi:hypothetical protein
MSSPENSRLENQCENAVSEKDTSAAGLATSMAAGDADSISKGACRLGWPTIIAAFIEDGAHSCTRCEKCDSCSIAGNPQKNSVADQPSSENCDE